MEVHKWISYAAPLLNCTARHDRIIIIMMIIIMTIITVMMMNKFKISSSTVKNIIHPCFILSLSGLKQVLHLKGKVHKKICQVLSFAILGGGEWGLQTRTKNIYIRYFIIFFPNWFISKKTMQGQRKGVHRMAKDQTLEKHPFQERSCKEVLEIDMTQMQNPTDSFTMGYHVLLLLFRRRKNSFHWILWTVIS